MPQTTQEHAKRPSAPGAFADDLQDIVAATLQVRFA